MSTPFNKAPEVEQALTSAFGFDRRATIEANQCCPPPIGCGGPAIEFRDDLSRKEYTISGLCQKCQDAFYGEDEEGAKMWTLDTALPFLREIEQAAHAWSCHVALAGSVLYQGYSSNDLDIHIYKRDTLANMEPTACFHWFREQGWNLQPCGGDRYKGTSTFEAFKGAQKINVFFMQKQENFVSPTD